MTSIEAGFFIKCWKKYKIPENGIGDNLTKIS
jgi:hypothetical protein